MDSQTPSSNHFVIQDISKRIGVPSDVVQLIIDEYVNLVVKCLEEEIPYSIPGLGKLYYIYRKINRLNSRIKATEFFVGKVHKELKFSVSGEVKNRLQNWVHDIGLKNNIDKKEMMRLAIQPSEIVKTRRQKVLIEQRAMGFRPDLLFDEDDIPEADKALIKHMDEAPSVEEMLEKLGVNIDITK